MNDFWIFLIAVVLLSLIVFLFVFRAENSKKKNVFIGNPNDIDLICDQFVDDGRTVTMAVCYKNREYFNCKIFIEVSTKPFNDPVAEDITDEVFFDLPEWPLHHIGRWISFEYIRLDTKKNLYFYKQADLEFKPLELNNPEVRTISVTVGVQTKNGIYLVSEDFLVKPVFQRDLFAIEISRVGDDLIDGDNPYYFDITGN